MIRKHDKNVTCGTVMHIKEIYEEQMNVLSCI